MRKIFYVLAVLSVCCGCVWSQGAAPSAPSPFTRDGDNIKNRVTSASNQAIYLITVHNGYYDTLTITGATVGDQAYLYATDWRFGSSTGPINNLYSDTLTVSASGRVYVGGDYIGEFVGAGLQNVGGTLTVNLTDLVTGSWIVNQTITRSDMDTTGTFVVGNLYDSTSADSTKRHMTKRYIDSSTVGLPFPTWQTGIDQDKVLKLDSTGGWHLTWADDAGAASGDAITLDSTIAAGGQWTTTNLWLIADPDSGISITRNGYTDSVFIKGTVANAVSVNGDTAATGKTWRWPDGRHTALDYVASDSVVTSLLLAGYVATSAWGIDGNQYYAGANALYPWVHIASRSAGKIYFSNDTTLASHNFSMLADTLFGDSVGKSAIKNIESIRTDSVILGTVILSADTSIASEGELEDSLDNYVSFAVENLRDSGSAGGDWYVLGNSNNQAFHVKHYITAAGDSSIIYNGASASSTKGTMELAGNRVRIVGGTGSTVLGSAVQFNSSANHQGQNIDSVKAIDVDTVRVDSALTFYGTVTPTAYLRFRAPATPSNVTFTLPSADGSSGQFLSTNGSGTLSWATGGTGGAGNPVYVGATLADSFIVAASGGLTANISVQDGPTLYLDTIRITADTTTTLATRGYAEDKAGDTAAALRTLDDEWKHSGTMTATTGTDSMWVLSSVAGVRVLNITSTHTGTDSTFVKPDAGGQLVVGKGGAGSVTYLDGDTIRITATGRSDRLYWGVGSIYIDSVLADSMINQKGVYATGGGGTGDITAVGSMLTGAAFADGTADQDWMGLGATSGRIQFKAQGSGVDDDAVLVPTGRLAVGRDTAIAYKFEVIDSSAASPTGFYVTNPDTTTSGGHAYFTIETRSKTDGTFGGDPTLTFQIANGSAGPIKAWSLGMDNSVSDRFKISYSDNVGTNDALVFDTNGYILADDGLYKNVYTADSMYSTVGFVKARKSFVQDISGGDVYWSYPTSNTLGNDTSVLVSFPFEAVGAYDSTFLVKCSTEAGTDTGFIILEAPFTDSVVVDTVVLYMKTSNATFSNVGLDSIVCTYQTVEGMGTSSITAQAAWNADWAGTSFTRVAITLSGATGTTFAPGDKLKIRLRINLTLNNSLLTVMKAQVKGTVQR